MRYTRNTSKTAQADAQTFQKRGGEYEGFVKLEFNPNAKTIRLRPSAEPTQWTKGNAADLLGYLEKKADELGVPGENIKCVFAPYDGPNPQISLRVGRGGQPYIMVGDPNYQPKRRKSEYVAI